MHLSCLTPSPDWDFPIFKVLANNDTSNAVGHQGGIVIPKVLRPFFPGLIGVPSPAMPTLSERVDAELFVENDFKSTVSTRYQFQTWGGTRSPESRLTDQLGPIRNEAGPHDVLVIQRSIDRLDLFRLTLVRKSSPEFALLPALISGRNWGVLFAYAPVTEADLTEARDEEKAIERGPFKLFDTSATYAAIYAKRIARSITFRETVLGLYNSRCAVCGMSLRTPSGLVESEAAHVVPRSKLGADDARNGFTLCKSHHWAFDKGLFGVGDDRKVIVPESVTSLPENGTLVAIRARAISEARSAALAVHTDAFAWHRANVLLSD